MVRILIGTICIVLFAAVPSGCALFGFDEDGGFDVPIVAEHTIEIPIDLSTLPASGQMSPMRLEQALDLPPVPVDLTMVDPEINENQDKIESIYITNIVVKPLSNTVTAPIPPIALAIGPFAATSPSEGRNVATIPSIPAMSVAQVQAAIDDAGMTEAQQWITSLQFSFIPSTTLVVEAGQVVPGGAAVLELTVRIQATVDPTK